MVAALYSSKPEKTKLFTRENVQFGWMTIEDMFEREVKRARDGVPRRVPGLRESYVHRDIWTRLNVKPAKIMQVSELMDGGGHYLKLVLPITYNMCYNIVVHVRAECPGCSFMFNVID